MKTILHAGCGGSLLPEWLDGKEVRLDIDERIDPPVDIVASITDVGDIGPFDAVYCSHTLEHLFPWDGDVALQEFHRVLKPGGTLILRVPDLSKVKPNEDWVYDSASGPICGLDMYYGWRPVVKNNPWMAHKTGFVPETLRAVVEKNGFRDVKIGQPTFELIAIGVK